MKKHGYGRLNLKGLKNRMKIDRKKVFEKYNGHCAYCGRKIEYKDMQVDHVKPQRNGGSDNLDNLMPSCRTCNHYKRANSLEAFRDMISKIPCKLARDSYIYKVGIAYGFYDSKQKDIKFYFERIEKPEDIKK